MFNNQKAVSRERLIGISFVDILIQAVFLLFIALTVGYQDPVVIEQIREYEAFGKDLCNKVNKSSVKECREVIEPTVDKALGQGLAVCIKPTRPNQSILSARFLVLSPKEIEFIEFTQEYISYLKNKNDEERLRIVNGIRKGVYLVENIVPTFGFIREDKCFHRVTIYDWIGGWEKVTLNPAFRELTKLQIISNKK
jgi:hypothetical protein